MRGMQTIIRMFTVALCFQLSVRADMTLCSDELEHITCPSSNDMLLHPYYTRNHKYIRNTWRTKLLSLHTVPKFPGRFDCFLFYPTFLFLILARLSEYGCVFCVDANWSTIRHSTRVPIILGSCLRKELRAIFIDPVHVFYLEASSGYFGACVRIRLISARRRGFSFFAWGFFSFFQI